MDQKLVAWGRAVKSRGRWQPGAPPPLWLFSDPHRIPDLHDAVARLPRGLCGVVFRHDAAPGRSELGRAVQALSRQRRLVMVVAGLPLEGPWAGRHVRQAKHAGQAKRPPAPRFRTASAHDAPAILRARRAGLDISFLSPIFPTASHPGQPALGLARWCRLARHGRTTPVFALGGIDGRTVRRLPRWVHGIGAIGALSPG